MTRRPHHDPDPAEDARQLTAWREAHPGWDRVLAIPETPADQDHYDGHRAAFAREDG